MRAAAAAVSAILAAVAAGSPAAAAPVAAADSTAAAAVAAPDSTAIAPAAALIGVLAPLTGPGAGLGNAFVEGVFLAVAGDSAGAAPAFALRTADTGGDPVQAALAAAALCHDRGCLALIGALDPGPTVAAALVADRCGVPLLSPTVAHPRLQELAEGVLQAGVSDAMQIRLLAGVGVEALLKKRYAVLAPASPDGRRRAGQFGDHVRALGGQVLATEFFATDEVDFQPQIERIRRQRPEVVFCPATVDQMALLGPQLGYYRCGSLIMGLGDWKDPRLLQLTAGSLERAVFPNAAAGYPPAWTQDFLAGWDAQAYTAEAQQVALDAYRAGRLLLEAVAGDPASARRDLAARLRALLDAYAAPAGDPDAGLRGISVIQDGAISAPAPDLFAAGYAGPLRPGPGPQATEPSPAGE